LHWIKNNPIDEDFIIMDDDKSLNDLPAFLKKNLITSSLIGLTEHHLTEINSLFNKGLG